MLFNIIHGYEHLHDALGISDERNAELIDTIKQIADNCMENGIASVDMREEGFQVHISLSNIIEEVVAKLAKTPEEVVICTMYVRQMQQKAEERCKLEALKQKLEKEIEEGDDIDF